MKIQILACFIAFSLIPPIMASDGVKKFDRKRFEARESILKNDTSQQQIATLQEKKPYAKSKKQAFFYSLLLPGLGELYQNDWKFEGWGSGLYYFAAEALLWSGHFYLKSYSNWQKEDSRSLAARNAGVDLFSPKPARYYVNIGKFSDIYLYNDFQRRMVGTSTLYAETGTNYWRWNSDHDRRTYDRMRIRSDSYRSFSQYMLWGIFTNHVLSSVNSMRIFRNRQHLTDAEFHFDIKPGMYRRHTYDVTAGFLVKF